MFVGIGLNLDNESPTTCLNAVLRKINSASHRLSREDVLASFFNKFENMFDIFSNQGKLLHASSYYTILIPFIATAFSLIY